MVRRSNGDGIGGIVDISSLVFAALKRNEHSILMT